jgi:hypothetical protein
MMGHSVSEWHVFGNLVKSPTVQGGLLYFFLPKANI